MPDQVLHLAKYGQFFATRYSAARLRERVELGLVDNPKVVIDLTGVEAITGGSPTS